MRACCREHIGVVVMIVGTAMLLIGLNASRALGETAEQEKSGSLVFTRAADGGYAFDTGVLRGRLEVGENVVVVGGGLIGIETAEFLSDQGKQVTVCEMLTSVAADVGPSFRWGMLSRIFKKVKILTLTKVLGIEEGHVIELYDSNDKINSVNFTVLGEKKEEAKEVGEGEEAAYFDMGKLYSKSMEDNRSNASVSIEITGTSKIIPDNFSIKNSKEEALLEFKATLYKNKSRVW